MVQQGNTNMACSPLSDGYLIPDFRSPSFSVMFSVEALARGVLD